MARQALKAKLTKILDLTPTVRELYLAPSEPFQFKTGQFVMLHVPQPEKPALRAYSIASADTINNEYRLVIKCYDIGIASTWIKSLKGGETIDFTGPFGKFSFREPPPEQVVFVATGTGLAPFQSMFLSVLHKYPNVDSRLLLGVWNENEIYYQKELEAARAKNPKLKTDFVLDTPVGDWKGLRGKVTDFIAKMDLTRPTAFYLCGNPLMLKAVEELLQSKNFPMDKVFKESFG